MRFEVAKVELGGTWIRAQGGGLPHPVTIRLEVGADGRLLVTGLLVEAKHELTARDLRFRLASVVTEFSAATTKPATLKRLVRERIGIEVEWEREPPASLDPDWRKLLLPEVRERPRRTRPGPRGHDDDWYRQLAREYRLAQREHPQRPIQALIEARGYSEPATHRQLREARKRGLLPPRRKEKDDR
jgi:hypothetical protein